MSDGAQKAGVNFWHTNSFCVRDEAQKAGACFWHTNVGAQKADANFGSLMGNLHPLSWEILFFVGLHELRSIASALLKGAQ